MGSVSTAVLRAWAAVFCVRARACPAAGSSARQKTSGAESAVFAPQLPTVPTTGARAVPAHSCASVLPIQVMSPCWLNCTRNVGAASSEPAPSAMIDPDAMLVRKDLLIDVLLSLLRFDVELDAPVVLAAFFRFVRVERSREAEALAREPTFVDAVGDEPLHDRRRAPRREAQIHRRSTAAVGVTFDLHLLDLGMLVENREDRVERH